MKFRWINSIRAVVAASLFAGVLAGCAQGGASTDGASATPSGNVTAYGVIDEGIAIRR
jgi:hypothetical protein